jgi:capsular exopolysaccharide synthesis family protein
MKQTRIYEAAASVQFDPNPPRPLGGKVESVVELGSGAVWDTREYYETQYQILQSRRVATAVVQQLGLNRDHAFLRNLPKGVEPPPADPVSDEDAADVLRARIRVEPVKQSRIANVKLQDADPERAARILRAVVETYREQNVDAMLESTSEATDWLRSEHDKLNKELESSELQLHKYKEDKNILSVEFDDKSNMLREEIAQLNQTLTNIRTRRIEVAARRAELAKVPADDPSSLPATELLNSAVLSQLRQDYIKAVRDRDGLLKSGLGRAHAAVQEADSKVETTRTALLAEVKNIQGALDRDLAVISKQEGGVAGLYENAKKEALDLNLMEIDYSRLRRSKENTEKLHTLLLERSKESDLTRRLRVNNVSIVDMPVVPKAPVKPNLPMNLAAGLAFGLLLGIGAAFGRSALDRTIKTPEDVEVQLGGTFLGLIPDIQPQEGAPRRRRRHVPTGQPELVVHNAPLSGVAEASRSIRTNLLFVAPDKPYRTLLVTSAGPSEGKTTVACCLAISMAQTGKRVLLVDCDFRRPRLHRIFRSPAEKSCGLTTALVDDGGGECVVGTEIPNLSIIPAGPIPPNPAELLQSERFKTFLNRTKQNFDLVVLDSPPLVAVTDATVLSAIVDGTVVVVRAFQTGKDLARHAHRLLTHVGAPIAGVVLNAVNVERDEYKYLYHYYRRGSYYSTEPQHHPERASERASPPSPPV